LAKAERGSHEGNGGSHESRSHPSVDSQALLTGKAQETAGLAQIVENGAKDGRVPTGRLAGARTG
jgi:hypothetical protein